MEQSLWRHRCPERLIKSRVSCESGVVPLQWTNIMYFEHEYIALHACLMHGSIKCLFKCTIYLNISIMVLCMQNMKLHTHCYKTNMLMWKSELKVKDLNIKNIKVGTWAGTSVSNSKW